MTHSARNLRLVFALVAAAILAACANIGHPEGGPRDETPPAYVGSSPRIGQLNVKSDRITIDFNENISLDDPSNKIVISPAQRTAPKISSNGRRVTIELRDSLLPNTTYTIDLADAVKDLNEGNVLDGLAIDFSTGSDIDSLRISGFVCEARTLEPAQGIIVGAHSVLADTAITRIPFIRIAKTNQYGQFTLRNLKSGHYRLFALADGNRDYKWDRSENVAFYGDIITPTAERTTFTDTIVGSAGKRDSVVTFPGTRFLPDDILLTWFNEGYSAQYLKDYQRPEHRKLSFTFGAKADTLPILKLLNTPRAGADISSWARLEATKGLDTLSYWITDSTILRNDTLLIEATYLRTDSTERLSPRTDTLKMVMRGNKTWAKLAEAEAKKLKDATEKLERRRRQALEKGDSTFSEQLPDPHTYVDFKMQSGAQQDLHRPALFRTSTPVAAIRAKGVHLRRQVDTTWVSVPVNLYMPDSLRPMDLRIDQRWEPETKYQIELDSAAVTDIYGNVNRPVKQELTTKATADYSSISFKITGLDSVPAIVEMLNAQDSPVATAPVKNGSVTVDYLTPGVYYARLFLDSDRNGEWTTGSLSDSVWRQPETVFYYPKKINLKKNWSIEQTWNLDELPVDLQKPREILKNKPKRRKDEEQKPASDEEEDEENTDNSFDSPTLSTGGRNVNPRLQKADRF